MRLNGEIHTTDGSLTNIHTMTGDVIVAAWIRLVNILKLVTSDGEALF